ncbi:RING/U-box superfamily protein, putative isoform 1 [Theobroma cacao]|uniref:RING-type E3 ubiquitin transferase n=1 Tax=Theobroma cacao TaxID=3641 RepID=A0A061EPW9_THECC|nr:RING/U-box superfamily protein, putative isoform 1 [Theobroma cacao]
MDANSERISQDVPLTGSPGHMEGDLFVDHSGQPALCTLCRRSLAPDYEATDDLETVGLCGDCKFLLLEDLASPPQDSHRRRPARRRRNRQSSSESIENLFSQHFSHMINLVRQNQSPVSGLEDQIMDGGSTARSLQRSSSRTTPSGSRRWRRVVSDTESDGFDNLDSIYGESESNVSFSQYRVFRGESDAISFSTYGGDSDASVDGHSFLDTEIFVQADNRSDIDTDTDIDPMHAGLNQWNWDEPEEDEGGDDDEWEEADAEEDVVEFAISRAGLQDLFISSPSETNLPVFNFRRSRAGFEQLLDHLAETDGSRRGAPPASASFVNNLPRVIVSDEHEKHDGLACAICKDVLPIGTEVNQLPCFHVYHPSCILPWLSARNSCPLCRYELPTDDKDYEEGKQHINQSVEIHQIQQQDASEDSSSDDSDEAEADEACELGPCRLQEEPHVDPTISSSAREGGRDWLFRAAAPLAGILGVVLVFWLGKPLIGRRGSTSHTNLPSGCQYQIQVPDTSSLNLRGSRSRRWWSLF